MEHPSSMELRAMLVSVGWGQDEHETRALPRDPVCTEHSEVDSRAWQVQVHECSCA